MSSSRQISFLLRMRRIRELALVVICRLVSRLIVIIGAIISEAMAEKATSAYAEQLLASTRGEARETRSECVHWTALIALTHKLLVAHINDKFMSSSPTNNLYVQNV